MGQQKPNHLAHYAEITTIHGIKDLVFSSSRILRLAWSLCLMTTMGLLCWYTYDTVKVYLSGPTIMRPSIARLETYPPIHVCSHYWFDGTQALSYNFTKKEISFLRFSFFGENPDGQYYWLTNIMDYQLTKESVKAKMEQHNLSSVQDMISIISWNVSVESQGDTARVQKRWLGLLDGINPYVCQSISNVNRNEDLEIKFPHPTKEELDGKYIVVGEDLYGEQVHIDQLDYSVLKVEIQWIQKRTLLNRPGFECTEHTQYDSAQACLFDCEHKREVCNCNGTASTAPYNQSESFWVLNPMFIEDIYNHYFSAENDLEMEQESLRCRNRNISSSCSQSYDSCIAQCKSCVAWNYHSTLTQVSNYTMPDVNLRFTKVPLMEVTEQAYSYTASSMLSYMGGLLGLFCGASVLSLVQVFLFLWGRKCHIGKGKVEDIAKQDNIQCWVEQAALHIPHCKQCSTVTASNIQFQRSEEAQTSQQKTNHLANYANNTTIHGIKDFLLMKNKFLELVWGLLLLALVSLMCEEIYRTVTKYIHAETARSIRFVDLDTYPPIHVCTPTWYNDTQARSYDFTQEELAFIRLAFQEPEKPGNNEDMWMKTKSIDGDNTAFEEQKKSIQLKMEQHNLKTVRDMLNLITWNLFIQVQGFFTSKRWRGRVLETVNSTYVCHSVSNASAEHDLSITLPERADPDEFIVVGEDPFAESIKYGYSSFSNITNFTMDMIWTSRQITLKIWDINKRSLLGKDGTCNKGYNSFGVCRQDCASKKDQCSCNGTIKIASYENNEDFFLLASRHDCRDDASCNQNYERCVEMCEPCTTWDYQVTTKAYDPDYDDVPLNITIVPRMKVSQEYYAYTVPSLLSNIGGLMGVFCGASVLSLIQLLLFWWDDGGLLCKTKGTNRDNADQHIKAWLQQAALRIPQCKLCKKLTSTRTQNKQGGGVKPGQQKSNHLANYAENTSIHGIKDLVFCKNKLIKLAWGLMLLTVFCLMCEEIYRTVQDYADYPTGIDESMILLDKYPPVHACVELSSWVQSDAQAKSYGFDDDEIATIWSMLYGSPVEANETQRESVKNKMQNHSLRSVQDMLNILTLNASIADVSMIPDDPVPQKRWRREDDGVDYVCYTFSNFTVRDAGLIIRCFGESTYCVVEVKGFFLIGEDPFALRYESAVKSNDTWYQQSLEVFIRESNQISLINKGGTCSHEYYSSGVCYQDCISKEAACNSNNTGRLPSYENNETFWLFDDPTNYANATCQHSHKECTAKCKLIPCTTWTYQSSAFLSRNLLTNYIFKLNIIPNMIVSKEYYTYPASSLLANIGGLVSLFCGGSLLSIIQVILYWWDKGCCGRKDIEEKEEIAVVPEDDIHKWIQHAALHRT